MELEECSTIIRSRRSYGNAENILTLYNDAYDDAFQIMDILPSRTPFL